MPEPTTIPTFDGSHFRRVLGHHPTGVCVVTAVGRDGRPVGVTVGSFTSVSLDPPLVAFLPSKGSRVLETIVEAGRFAVNLLGGDQVELCRRFASRDRDRFDATPWRPSPLGSPLLIDAPAWIDCTLHSVLEIGDHALVVGAVTDLDVERPTAPLMFFQGGYGSFSSLSLVAEGGNGGSGTERAAGLATHLRLADLARPRLEEVSARFGVNVAAAALVGREVIQLAWVGPDAGTHLGGVRLPFVAPFGTLFAAWETDEVREEWLRDHQDDDLVRRTLLEDLARAREQGCALLPDHNSLREIEARIARIATDGHLPASVRELDLQIADFARRHVSLHGEQPRGISAPVFDGTGRVALTLTAHRLPELNADRLDECREALLEAGRELTEIISGRGPRLTARPA
ncbi:flavin reductase [Pseudonocardia kujensis]|uniref:flavin reductase n=1 Tax=Pseudonocardia kujensis TaxID=1128675 RepID=UPI001E30B397|nr:flavin reductase [Pseudonocardia kujensis]MCE0763311.1 flavin reductase [Pseudonocardia kujensis]